MPQPITTVGSEYNQASFLGGMNLLGDDSRLQPNQYRAGFNLTNRYDTMDPILSSQVDVALQIGLKQEMVTFGNYIIVFVRGFAYYRFYLSEGWTQIQGFQMSPTAARFWTCAVPVSTTNYVRVSNITNVSTANQAGAGINLLSVESAGQGNLPGLLVQDNINQPQFIFLSNLGVPTVRTTQSFTQWSITFTDATNTVVALDSNNNSLDNREYVPIGSSMSWVNGILFMTAQDGESILRSVSGRPLDFVINVTNILALNTTIQTWTYTDITTGQSVDVDVQPFTMSGGGCFDGSNVFHQGGDAYTTSYSVGVGGIVCLRPLSTGGLFVAASNANFSVTLNTSQNAPTLFGEYTFLRTFLFNATCLSDRTIFDSIGDTRFISLTGVRSFNAIEQTENEGRNTPFTAQIMGAFGTEENPIIQDATATAAILYNDYELYAVNTIFGPAIVKYDTINGCWSSFDILQTGGKAIKMFAKIELTIQRLYAITTDDKLYTLYIGPDTDEPQFRSVGICANFLYANSNIKMANPKAEIQLKEVRAILNKITANCSCEMIPYMNNRIDEQSDMIKEITFEEAVEQSTFNTDLPDTNTQLMNLLWSLPAGQQGWKLWLVFKWSKGSFTQFSCNLKDLNPGNPLKSQVLSK